MDNKGKPKSLAESDKLYILGQVYKHIGTHVEQASWLRLSVPTLNPVVKNYEEIVRSSVPCKPFSKQQKS
jgi:hypothetical protein